MNMLMASPVSVNGKLKVSGLQLVNECGNPVQLRGVSTHGLQWYSDCLPDASLSFAANGMGADIVRIAMYVDENGYLTNPSQFTNTVDTLVDKIGALGMYALIDWHVLTPGDPNAHLADAGTFWQHEATQHKGKKYVLYEICNEPNGVNWATVKQYADNIIPKIRAIDPDTVIICGTPNWSQLGADVVANQLSYANVMYAFHFYSATHATSKLTPYVGSLPIFCTEWAASTSSGNGTLDTANATNFLNIMGGSNSAGVKISWCSWSFSDAPETSAMFNANTCPNGPYDASHLSTEGNFIKTSLSSPADAFTACNGQPTNTPVVANTATYTRTRTPSFTVTVTPSFTRTVTVTFTRTVTRTVTPSFTLTSTPNIATPTPTKTATPYAGTPTQTFTLSPVPTPGLVNADCVEGQVFNLTDGNLNDAIWQTGVWSAVTKTVEGAQGAVTANFKVRWDSTGLKVGVDVTDPALCNSGANWYNDDAVEIYIDAANNRATTYDANDYQFSIRYGDPVLREENGRTGTVAAATYRTALGYSAEFNIPWPSLGVTGSSGTNIGLDVGIDHNETCGATRDGVLMWNGTGNNYQDTSAFGNAVMLACASTPSFTATRTRTATLINTATNTPVNTQTNTPVNMATYTSSITMTNTPVNTNTNTRTATPTFTNTPVNTPTFTRTNTPSFTPTPTSTPSRTSTQTFTNTPYYTPSVTPSVTETETGTPPSPTDTPTSTPSFTITATYTDTAAATFTSTPTVTPTGIPTETCTNSPVNTATCTQTLVNTATDISTPENTVTNTQTPSETTADTAQPENTFTKTPSQTVTQTATAVTPTAIVTPVNPGIGEIIYPNPYNPGKGNLNVGFYLENQSNKVEFLVYSKGLRLVSKANLGEYPAGFNKAEVDKKYFSNLASGIYYYIIVYKNNTSEKRSKISGFIVLH